MKEFIPNQTINGTFGEMWFDDDYLGEAEEAKAELNANYTAVQRVSHLISGQKLTSIDGKGSFKLHHVRSNIAVKMATALKSGKTPSFKIITKLADPDALGHERVVLYGCKLDKAILMDWAVGKLTEESYNFTFEDFDFLDSINA